MERCVATIYHLLFTVYVPLTCHLCKENWVGRRELNPHKPQSQCGALPIERRPTQDERQGMIVTRHLIDVFTIGIRSNLAGRVGFEPTHLLIENQAA